ncbi:abc-type zinc uptake system zinc chaperone [Shewanella decolorationis S12]|uniref:Abc-type zinc uptake system zinc chaperone n=1 Tax=Shewanella decolorationis S12 TaxID=1353536 RepID=A0ABP2YZG9_9GAMM|nr:abc-type zinc uptake system zinc chaperone [Shewanella decolorationis S12]
MELKRLGEQNFIQLMLMKAQSTVRLCPIIKVSHAMG